MWLHYQLRLILGFGYKLTTLSTSAGTCVMTISHTLNTHRISTFSPVRASRCDDYKSRDLIDTLVADDLALRSSPNFHGKTFIQVTSCGQNDSSGVDDGEKVPAITTLVWQSRPAGPRDNSRLHDILRQHVEIPKVSATYRGGAVAWSRRAMQM